METKIRPRGHIRLSRFNDVVQPFDPEPQEKLQRRARQVWSKMGIAFKEDGGGWRVDLDKYYAIIVDGQAHTLIENTTNDEDSELIEKIWAKIG